MKTIACVLTLVLCSCGTGTVVTFGKGGIAIQGPTEPVVIPTK